MLKQVVHIPTTVVYRVKTISLDFIHHLSLLKPLHLGNWFYIHLQVKRIPKKTHPGWPLHRPTLKPGSQSRFTDLCGDPEQECLTTYWTL
jgi:hypothetical protein